MQKTKTKIPFAVLFSVGAVLFSAHAGGGFATGNQAHTYYVGLGWLGPISAVGAMLLLTLCHATVPAVIAMGVAASCYGGFASVLTPLTAQVFGSKYITENYGVMYIVFGLASLIGPVLAVRLRTPDGAYTWAFAAAAVLAAVGLILNCIVPLTAGKEAPHGK